MRLWEEALAATTEPAAISDLRRSMAITTIYIGEVADAVAYADLAIAAAEAAGDEERIAYAVGVRAFTAVLAGDPSYRTYVDRALALADLTGAMRLPATRLQAQIDAHLGRAEEARETLVGVVAEAEAHGENM